MNLTKNILDSTGNLTCMRKKLKPDNKAFTRAFVNSMYSGAVLQRGPGGMYGHPLYGDPGSDGCGCGNPTDSGTSCQLQMQENTQTGTNVQFVLSNTPNQGFVWEIQYMSGYCTGAGNPLNFFLMRPGQAFPLPLGAASAIGFGVNLPGCISLGYGKEINGSRSFADVNGVGEGSIMQLEPGMVLEAGWRLGIIELGVIAASHTVGLRYTFYEKPACNTPTSKVKPIGVPIGHGITFTTTDQTQPGQLGTKGG